MAVVSRKREQLNKVCQEIGRYTSVYYECFDIRNECRVIEFIRNVVNRYGRINFLINNAGYVKPLSLLETTLDDWKEQIDINLTGAFLMTREVVRYMKEYGGKIINIASTAGLSPRPGWSAYAASKAALINFSLTMSEELKQLIKDLDKKGTKVIEELFVCLRETKLNPVQELLVLEVALRIINADAKHDENEVKFIHLLRSKLELHDETINDRFGELDILYTNEYSRNIVAGKSEIEFAENVKLPEMSEFIQIDLKDKKTE